jgi:hypothetical protein
LEFDEVKSTMLVGRARADRGDVGPTSGVPARRARGTGEPALLRQSYANWQEWAWRKKSKGFTTAISESDDVDPIRFSSVARSGVY